MKFSAVIALHAEDDWSYWFDPVESVDVQKAFELISQSELYETALLNYNILVDLSWTITYVTAEYALYKFDKESTAFFSNSNSCLIYGNNWLSSKLISSFIPSSRLIILCTSRISDRTRILKLKLPRFGVALTLQAIHFALCP